MSTSRVHVCIPAALRMGAVATLLVVAGAGCSNDDDPTIDTSSAPVTVDTGDIPLPVVTGDIPLPVVTGDIPAPPPINTSDLAHVFAFEVTVGVDASPDRVERVPVGSSVTFVITNPTSDDEFHLHGYDYGDGVLIPAGQPSTFTLVVDRAGEFEIESHETGEILMTLSVG